MYLEDNENIRNQKVIIDPFIHKKAKLSRTDFLDKVSSVKYIRTKQNSLYTSFYMSTIDEVINLKKFHDLINKGEFDFDEYVFAVAVQPKFYEWFKGTEYLIIQKQIVSWLAGAYYFQKEKRHLQKEQLYKPLYEEVLAVVEEYYRGFPVPNIEELTDKLFELNDEESEKKYEEEVQNATDKYLEVCKKFYGGKPPSFLSSPYVYEYEKEWGVNERYNFEFIEAFFTDNDWERIITQGKKDDDMQRSESRDDFWEKWKLTFKLFDKTKKFVYGFYFEDDKRETKKIRREVIPQEVKDAVWRRDEGKCVECGTNEKLEFDHIIPFSKGGSSTYRNVQLLCEKHNREKHNRLGD